MEMIKQAGFKRVVKSGFGQSSQAVLRDMVYFDKEKLKKISQFVRPVRA